MKCLALIALAVLTSSAFAHNARYVPLNYWDEVYVDIANQVSTPNPYATRAWAPLLRRVASKPLPPKELLSAVSDYVYQKFAEQGVRVEGGESLFRTLEKLFTPVPVEQPSLEALRAMGWSSEEEYREFEKRRLLIGGRDMVLTATLPAANLTDVRGLALALEIVKPGSYLKPEVRRFLASEDVEYLAQAHEMSCSWRLLDNP